MGSQLVEAAEKWAAGKSAHEVFVNSGLHCDEAHRLASVADILEPASGSLNS
jgi:hypothetical protein